jgi:hypothetical protein
MTQLQIANLAKVITDSATLHGVSGLGERNSIEGLLLHSIALCKVAFSAEWLLVRLVDSGFGQRARSRLSVVSFAFPSRRLLS